MTYLIVGLGNPGQEYENTRHNVGFILLESLPTKKDWDEKKKNIWEEASLETSKKVVLLRPLTFMNKSGLAVSQVAKSYKIKPDNILVIHDDLDIEVGKIKMSFDKSAALHKGVDSVIKNLKTQKFWRLRVGISPKRRDHSKEMKDFLLHPMTASEKKKILENRRKIHDGIFLWLEDHASGMQLINTD